MREQEAGGEAGRRGGVIRALLGVARLAEDDAAVAVGGASKKKAEAPVADRNKAVVRVVAADMPPALQRRAFRCARDELAAMPHYPRRLEPKRIALALKKVRNRRVLLPRTCITDCQYCIVAHLNLLGALLCCLLPKLQW
jgi:dynein light chain LC8-type